VDAESEGDRCKVTHHLHLSPVIIFRRLPVAGPVCFPSFSGLGFSRMSYWILLTLYLFYSLFTPTIRSFHRYD
jgi:hypothetical protein